MKKNIVTASLILSTLSMNAIAQTQVPNNVAVNKLSEDQIRQLTISSVDIKELPADYRTQKNMLSSTIGFNGEQAQQTQINDGIGLGAVSVGEVFAPIQETLDQVDVIVDKVVNIGAKVWKVVDKGRPVASYSLAKANALPENITNWQQLENWKEPTSKIYQIEYKNGFNMVVARLVYRVVLVHGGSIKGIGKYIGLATIEPIEMRTAFGFTFNASVTVDYVYNMNKSADPLAGMTLSLKWVNSTIVQKIEGSHRFHLDGNGVIKPL